MSKRKTTTAGADAADVKGIHKRLKEIVRGELDKLPELLERLTPEFRIAILRNLFTRRVPKFCITISLIAPKR